MSPVSNLWRQLVERRLWPVAVLLLAALAAVPFMLAKEPAPEPAPAIATAPAAGKDELAVKPIVAPVSSEERTQRRHVLGGVKNPFPAKKANDDVAASDAPTDTSGTSTAPGGDAPDPAAPSGGDSGGGGSTPPAGPAPAPGPAPDATPKPPVKTYAVDELTVRFGGSEEGPKRRSLERLQPLPSEANPVLIYLGVLDDGKTAVFLVGDGVQAIGDGECRPTPEACEKLRLREGETEFFDVTAETAAPAAPGATAATGTAAAQYQLDLLKIHRGKTASASRAKISSKAGSRRLAAHVSSAGSTGDRWSAPSGALRATVAGARVALP